MRQIPGTAADHVTVIDMALAALPPAARPERADPAATQVLVRTDAAGATHTFAAALRERGCRFSLGFGIDQSVQEAVLAVPESGWSPANDIDGKPREGAWVAEITGALDLASWPSGGVADRAPGTPAPRGAAAVHRRRRSPLHRLLDRHTPGGQLPGLEVRHRSHTRVEDRIRAGKATDLRNLPCKDYLLNRVWLELSLAATDLLT